LLLKLQVVLNYAVFLQEIKEDTKQALEVGKGTFDEVIEFLSDYSDSNSHITETVYKDITCFMPLLRDNCTLWSEDDS
jgi:hypothetical protein